MSDDKEPWVNALAIEYVFMLAPDAVSPIERLVMLALARFMNDAGECWPSYPTLMDRTSLSRRAIEDALRKLTERGHVLRTVTPGRVTRYGFVAGGRPYVAGVRKVAHTPAPRAGVTPAPRAHTPAPRADEQLINKEKIVNEKRNGRQSDSVHAQIAKAGRKR